MTVDPEDVCTLPPEGLAQRLLWIRDEILPHAVGTERLPDGLAIELRAAPGLSGRVDRLVELERDCCGDLDFRRVAGSTDDRLRLEIHGADPDAPMFAALPRTGTGGGGVRLAKAAGAGVLAGLLLCCVLPIGAVALIGAAAAPLAGLDAPLPIALTASGFGLVAWGRLGRRRVAPAAGCGSGC